MPTFPITVSAVVSDNVAALPAKSGPYINNAVTALYCVGGVAGGTGVFKSTDGGNTWDQIPGQEIISGGASCRDEAGVNRFYIAYTDIAGNVVGFIPFNMDTDEFGTPVLGPGPVAGLNLFVQSVTHRASTNDLIAVFRAGASNALCSDIPSFVVYDLDADSWGSFTTFTAIDFDFVPPDGEFYQWAHIGMCNGASGRTHTFFFQTAGGPAPVPVGRGWHQCINSNNSLVAPDEITDMATDPTEDVAIPNFDCAYDPDSGEILINYTQFGFTIPRPIPSGPANIVDLAVGVATEGASLSFATELLTATVAPSQAQVCTLAVSDGVHYAFVYVDESLNPGGMATFYSFEDSGGGFGSRTTVGAFDNSGGNVGGFQAVASQPWSFIFSGTIYFWGVILAPSSIATRPAVGGGIFFPRTINRTFLTASIFRTLAPFNPSSRVFNRSSFTFPSVPEGFPYSFPGTQVPPISSFFNRVNEFDICLHREFRIYDLIDREALSCARKLECFLTDERAWTDAPAGFRTFNPGGAIPLPLPAAADVVIFSFRVPLGYDGMILGQFHGFTGDFTEGSGDLEWRVRVNGRYLKDMGQMLVSIGSNRTLSPVYGGLQLRSKNLVEYLVFAPNLSASLDPSGNIIAGLHGYVWPRK